MNARSMVFDVGDRVTGWGQVVADSDGHWLDLPYPITLEWPKRPRPRSARAIRLIGADINAVPTDFGPNVSPGFASFIGIWREDAIEVESQSSKRPHYERPSWITPPCPAPPSGWPHGDHDENPHHRVDIDDLLASGAAVTVVTFRPSQTQAVLVVAATDVTTVRAALQAQIPGRFCVVPSPWSRTYIDDIRAHIDGRWTDWELVSTGEQADDRARPCITAELRRVTADLADWADTLPTGLLHLRPAFRRL